MQGVSNSNNSSTATTASSSTANNSNNNNTNSGSNSNNPNSNASSSANNINNNNNNNNSTASNNVRASTIDVPVRILVPSESVGAIIGKGGETIRQLTKQTHAKVDVYRGDPMAPSNTLQEKVITIRGQPENCINACREILKVMKADNESKNKPSDMPLKILAHNDYIGRIIGKQGNIINTIKKDTDTTVTVSSVTDLSMNVERVITVKGELENMIKALEIIHTKVKSAFENDTKMYGPQAIMIPPMPLVPPAYASSAAAVAYNVAPNNSAARYAVAAAAAAAAAQQQHQLPNSATGQLGIVTNSPMNAVVQPGNPATMAHALNPMAPHSSPANTQSQTSATTTNYSGYYPAPLYHHTHVISATHPHAPHNPHAGGANATGNMYGASSNGPHGSQGAQPAMTHPSHGMHNPHHHAHHQPAQATHQPLNDINNIHNGMHNGMMGPMGTGSPMEPEKVFLYIPNVAVGAIIGTKGSFIKNIIKMSGASVKITPLTPEESKTADERQVVIVGMPESQWKAQFYIFEKIRQERFTTDENVKLRAELQVPSHIVGRIIGKAGKNVRELQRITGATIKLPDEALQLQKENKKLQQQAKQQGEQSEQQPSEQTSQSETSEQNKSTTKENKESDADQQSSTSDKDHQQQQQQQASSNDGDFVTVRIFGTYNASQMAQRRIQSLIQQSLHGGSTQLIETNLLAPIAPMVPPPAYYPAANLNNSYNPMKSGGGAYQMRPEHYHQANYHHQQPHHNYNPRVNGGSGETGTRRNRRQQQQQQQQTGNNNGNSSMNNGKESNKENGVYLDEHNQNDAQSSQQQQSTPPTAIATA